MMRARVLVRIAALVGVLLMVAAVATVWPPLALFLAGGVLLFAALLFDPDTRRARR